MNIAEPTSSLIPQSQDSANDRLDGVRERLKSCGLDAVIFPSSDTHLSEYVPENARIIRWISGFDGSAGTLAVTQDEAMLWLDSRYWEQGERQLKGSSINLGKQVGGNATQGYTSWLSNILPSGARVGFDAERVSITQQRLIQTQLTDKSIRLYNVGDIVAPLWHDREPMPTSTIIEHAILFAVTRRSEKLEQVRQLMRQQGAAWYLASALDEVAWLTNLRASDVPYNPVFFGHCLVGINSATLFVNVEALSDELAESLRNDRIQVASYDELPKALAALRQNTPLLLDPTKTTAVRLSQVCAPVIEGVGPATLLKSRKNADQIHHIRNTMVEDGIALVEFLAWLDGEIPRGELRESDLDMHLTRERARKGTFVSRSFPTISAFGPSAALPHYVAVPGADRRIQGDGLLLIDSGGQYFGGTTDITRMIAVGEPTAAQRKDVTLALKGMIALSSAAFPSGTRTQVLDALARAPIWAELTDFGHATGHGVGYFLNVHEGPQTISYASLPSDENVMREGMITSIEPGVYRPGRWGVRLENLVACLAKGESEFGNFLQFETLTLCPIDVRCLDLELMTAAECKWLDEYHTTVWERLSDGLSRSARRWLRTSVQSVQRPQKS